MPKITKGKEEEIEKEVATPAILPLTQEFGNGDLNTLRDKINELIHINN